MSTIRRTLTKVPFLSGRETDRDLTPYLLVGPAILTVFLVTIGPMLWSLWLSFTRWKPGSLAHRTPSFTGAENYAWLFTNQRFIDSVINFAYYGGFGVFLQVTLGTFLALALYNYVENRTLRFGLITLFTVPMMYAPLVAGRMWQLLLLPGGGVVNGILGLVGLPQVSWLGSRWLGLTSIMIADTWQWVGLPLLIVYGGRASLSDSLYEAARVDGASRWMMFRRITLPQLRNLIIVAAILRFMDAYKFFDKLFIMTRGGPGSATELPTFFTYLVGFQNFNIGRAAALTWVLGLGSILTMLLFWRYMRTVEGV
jgi:multiple sugar transport system permease protein